MDLTVHVCQNVCLIFSSSWWTHSGSNNSWIFTFQEVLSQLEVTLTHNNNNTNNSYWLHEPKQEQRGECVLVLCVVLKKSHELKNIRLKSLQETMSSYRCDFLWWRLFLWVLNHWNRFFFQRISSRIRHKKLIWYLLIVVSQHVSHGHDQWGERRSGLRFFLPTLFHQIKTEDRAHCQKSRTCLKTKCQTLMNSSELCWSYASLLININISTDIYRERCWEAHRGTPLKSRYACCRQHGQKRASMSYVKNSHSFGFCTRTTWLGFVKDHRFQILSMKKTKDKVLIALVTQTMISFSSPPYPMISIGNWNQNYCVLKQSHCEFLCTSLVRV